MANEFVNQVLLQMLAYGSTFILAFAFLAWLMGSFLFKFIKVKASRGKLKLLKIREVDFDTFAIAKIDSGFLVFTYLKNEYRIPIPTPKVFYRALGVTWVDFDAEKNAYGLHDYSTVSGHDGIKTQNFLKRILMQPHTEDNFQKIMLILIIVTLLILLIACVFIWTTKGDLATLTKIVNEIAANTRPSIPAQHP